MKKVGIIMGSASDLPVVKKAADLLKEFGVPSEVHVYSAHRTPEEARDFARNARGGPELLASAGIFVFSVPCAARAGAGLLTPR